MKKSSSLRYFLKDGASNFRLHRVMTTASVMMLAACFLVIGIFLMIFMDINLTIDKVGMQNEIVIFLQDYVDDASAEDFGYTLKEMENIESVTFVSRDEGLRDFSENLGGDDIYNSYADDNPIRHSYRIIVKDLSLIENTRDALIAMPKIARVRASIDTVKAFLKFRNVATFIGVALVAILAMIAAVVVSNTIRLTTFARREEIAIMKMVGATNRFIRASFLVEGGIIGLLAAAVAYVLLFVLYEFLLVPELSLVSLISFVEFSAVWHIFLAVFLLAGLFYGIVISFFTIKKYLRV